MFDGDGNRIGQDDTITTNDVTAGDLPGQ